MNISQVKSEEHKKHPLPTQTPYFFVPKKEFVSVGKDFPIFVLYVYVNICVVVFQFVQSVSPFQLRNPIKCSYCIITGNRYYRFFLFHFLAGLKEPGFVILHTKKYVEIKVKFNIFIFY